MERQVSLDKHGPGVHWLAGQCLQTNYMNAPFSHPDNTCLWKSFLAVRSRGMSWTAVSQPAKRK